MGRMPAVVNPQWGSLAGGVKNNYDYFDHVIDPALNKLKSGAVKLKAHFAKKFTARKAFLLPVGTDYIETGVGEWRKTDLLAANGELALNLHSCAPGEQLFDQANYVLLLSLDDMEEGREQLVKLFCPVPAGVIFGCGTSTANRQHLGTNVKGWASTFPARRSFWNRGSVHLPAHYARPFRWSRARPRFGVAQVDLVPVPLSCDALRGRALCYKKP